VWTATEGGAGWAITSQGWCFELATVQVIARLVVGAAEGDPIVIVHVSFPAPEVVRIDA
jgi:hypothetical protein